MNGEWWEYDNLPSGAPYDWSPAARGENMFDNIDFHLDLGCGKLKKGRLGIDRYYTPQVDLAMDLDGLQFVPLPSEIDDPELARIAQRGWELCHGGNQPAGNHPRRLPFPDGSIKSIVSHHAMEHIGNGFIRLIDECHRVLEPGGILRIIVPLFPSRTAVEDPDHKRWFMTGTFDAFCGTKEGTIWLEGFSEPYTKARFQMLDKDYTRRSDDPEEWWGLEDAREIRVALRKYPEEEQHANVRDGEVHEGRGDDLGAETGEPGGTPEAGRDRDLAGVR